MTPIVILAATLIGAAIHLWRSKQPRTRERVVEVLALYMLVGAIGVMGLVGASGHLFAAHRIAEDIGWPTGSPFQFEVGMANLAFGVCGILCIWLRGGFWMATGLAASIYLFGDGIGHIRETIAGDHAAYNAGPTLYTDFIIAVVTMALLIAHTLMAREPGERLEAGVARLGTAQT